MRTRQLLKGAIRERRRETSFVMAEIDEGEASLGGES